MGLYHWNVPEWPLIICIVHNSSSLIFLCPASRRTTSTSFKHYKNQILSISMHLRPPTSFCHDFQPTAYKTLKSTALDAFLLQHQPPANFLIHNTYNTSPKSEELETVLDSQIFWEPHNLFDESQVRESEEPSTF